MTTELINALPTWGYPTLLGVIVVVVLWQKTLGWRTYSRIHRLKIRFLPLIDRFTPLFVVSNKSAPDDDAEYLTTVQQSVQATFEQLSSAGGSPHLLNSVKRLPDGTYSAAHLLWIHGDNSQTEAYLFEAGDGHTHVYVHHETSVLDPKGHLADPQRDGDVRGVVGEALGISA